MQISTKYSINKLFWFPPRSGVISWVTQGLTKVLPQPDAKYKEEETKNPEEHTEVRVLSYTSTP